MITQLSLIFQGIRKKTKSSILLFVILLLSVLFTVISISIKGSIDATSDKFRKDTYGDWYFACITDQESHEDIFKQIDGITGVGQVKNIGTVMLDHSEFGLGVADQDMISLGRLKLSEGSFPHSPDEVALEEKFLSQYGENYKVGNELTLKLSIPFMNPDDSDQAVDYITIEHSFILCGIVKEYSSVWTHALGTDAGEFLLPSAFISTETAEDLINNFERNDHFSYIQYFISADNEIITDQGKSYFLEKTLKESLTNQKKDSFPAKWYVNDAILPPEETIFQNSWYLYLVMIVTFTSLMAVFFLYFADSARSASILRSIGMDVKELTLITLEEMTILAIPALAAGLFLGYLAVKWAIRFTSTATNIDPIVIIPYGKLAIILCIWYLIIVFCSIFKVVILIQRPLTGSFSLTKKELKFLTVGRYILNGILLIILGTTVWYSAFEASMKYSEWKKDQTSPHYMVIGSTDHDNMIQSTIPESVIDDLKNSYGIRKELAYSYSDAALSYEGLEERKVQFIIIRSEEFRQWDPILKIGTDEKAFLEGNLVFVCFPYDNVDTAHVSQNAAYVINGEQLDESHFVLPKDKAKISLYQIYGDNHFFYETDASYRFLDFEADRRLSGIELHCPYTIVCTDAFFKKVLASKGDDSTWFARYLGGSVLETTKVIYAQGNNFGYRAVDLWAQENGNSLLIDTRIQKLCQINGLEIINNRARYTAQTQMHLQNLITTSSLGLCIGFMVFLILLASLSLEREQEYKKYAILKTIGMSSGQIKRSLLCQSLIRGSIATVLGLLLYCFYKIEATVYKAAHPVYREIEPYDMTVSEAIQQILRNLNYYGIRKETYLVIISISILAIIVGITMLIKRKLGKAEIF